MKERIKKIIPALVLLIFCSSCSVFEDFSEARNLVKEFRYEKAIENLSTKKSERAKIYNSQVHTEYAIYKLKDIKVDRLQRYKEAKEILEQALKLDSKNLEAKNYFLMISKTINHEFPEIN